MANTRKRNKSLSVKCNINLLEEKLRLWKKSERKKQNTWKGGENEGYFRY